MRLSEKGCARVPGPGVAVERNAVLPSGRKGPQSHDEPGPALCHRHLVGQQRKWQDHKYARKILNESPEVVDEIYCPSALYIPHSPKSPQPLGGSCYFAQALGPRWYRSGSAIPIWARSASYAPYPPRGVLCAPPTGKAHHMLLYGLRIHTFCGRVRLCTLNHKLHLCTLGREDMAAGAGGCLW